LITCCDAIAIAHGAIQLVHRLHVAHHAGDEEHDVDRVPWRGIAQRLGETLDRHAAHRCLDLIARSVGLRLIGAEAVHGAAVGEDLQIASLTRVVPVAPAEHLLEEERVVRLRDLDARSHRALVDLGMQLVADQVQRGRTAGGF
jgi:hypothetical protein